MAVVGGDAVVWELCVKAPRSALAVQALFGRACERHGDASWRALSQLLIGGAALGAQLVDDARIALLSATGSTRMGRTVGPKVAARFGRCLLELGGNNAIVVTPSADLDLAVRAILFGAVGTAGPRCTTTRRLIVHEQVHAALVHRLRAAYERVRIGTAVFIVGA